MLMSWRTNTSWPKAKTERPKPLAAVLKLTEWMQPPPPSWRSEVVCLTTNHTELFTAEFQPGDDRSQRRSAGQSELLRDRVALTHDVCLRKKKNTFVL